MSDKYIMSGRQADDVAAEIDRLRADNEKLREENERILAHKLALEWFPTLEKQVGCYDYRVATKEITRSFDVFRKRLLDPCYEENTRLRAENERLREALKPLAAITLWTDKYPDGPLSVGNNQRYIDPQWIVRARTALEGVTKKSGAENE